MSDTGAPEPLDIDGCRVLFPFKPYGIQLDYMRSVIQCLQQKSNGLLESPTGTGKTLCILCAALGWLDRKQMDAFDKHMADKVAAVAAKALTDPMNGDQLTAPAAKSLNGWQLRESVPKILYSSRTHSQLSQACKELKRTSYRTFKSVVIGSREQLCINPEVTKLDTMSAKNQMCRFKANHNQCQWYRQYEQKVERSVEYGSGMVFDIEDLVRMGKANTCCPYYAARHIQKSAALIFMPYNYILDPRIRASNKFDLTNAVVVFDEGHNIERQCEEAVSTELRSDSFAVVIKCMTQLLEKLREVNNGNIDYDGSDLKELMDMDVEAVAKLHMFICDLEMAVDSMIKAKKDQKVTHDTREMFFILEKVGLDVTGVPALFNTLQQIMMFITSSPDSGSPQSMAYSAGFSAVNEFLEKLIPMTVTTPEVYETHKTQFVKNFKIFSQKGSDFEDDKSTNFWNKKNNPDSWLLNVWCLSPSVGAKAILDAGVHNMIITSGTLAPIYSFESEMGINFDVKLQNNHIIGANQLSIMNICQSRDKVVLTSKYDNRDNMDYYRALGQTLVDLLRAIPKGVLVFFSSYTALNKCIQVWKQYRHDNIWDKLNAAKQVFLEPRSKQAFNDCFLKYKQTIDNSQSNGAVFFGVFRGKLSEGIDLPDDYCRGVILTGLPFPALMDPRVILKKQYLNENKAKLSGDSWYGLQMKRALNQAIGRVVRHKDDFGVIILLDSRFASMNDGLSKWVVPYISRVGGNGVESSLNKLEEFFSNRGDSPRALAPPLPTTTPTVISQQAFNNQFNRSSNKPKQYYGRKSKAAVINNNRLTESNAIMDAFKGAANSGNTPKSKSIFDRLNVTNNSQSKPLVVNNFSANCSNFLVQEIDLVADSPKKKPRLLVPLKSITLDEPSPTLLSKTPDLIVPLVTIHKRPNVLENKAMKPLHPNTSVLNAKQTVIDISKEMDEDSEEIISIASSETGSVATSLVSSTATGSTQVMTTHSEDNIPKTKCLSECSPSKVKTFDALKDQIRDFWVKNGPEFRRLFEGTNKCKHLVQSIRKYQSHKKLEELINSFNTIFQSVDKAKRDHYIQNLALIVRKTDRPLFLSKCLVNDSQNEFKEFKRADYSIQSQYECLICQVMPSVVPHRTLCCGYIACLRCFKKLISKLCPKCDKPFKVSDLKRLWFH